MHRAIILIVFAWSVSAATWTPPAGRLPWGTGWDRAKLGVEGGIPASSGKAVYATHTSAATAAQINTSLANCPSNQVVALEAGEFTLTDNLRIPKDGVILRGSGTNTLLKFTGANNSGIYGLITVTGTFQGDNEGTVKNVTAGYTQGSTTLTLSDTTGLAVGQIGSFDQLNDYSGVGVTRTNYEPTEATFLSRSSGTRAQAQLVRIENISGNDITISHGVLMINYQSDLSPQFCLNGTPYRMVGIEDLTITNAISSGGPDANILFFGTWNGWVKNVNSLRASKAHVRTYWSGRIEVRDSYFTKTFAYASQSYGMNISYYASFCLIENNIFYEVTTPMFNWGAGGCNAFLHNSAFNTRYDTTPGWQVNSLGTHGGHQHMCLYEGNYTPNAEFDYIHGSSSHNLAFRNRFTGRHSASMNQQTYPIVIDKHNRFITIAACVLGEDGYHTLRTLENVSSSAQEHKAIYKLGYAVANSLDTSTDDPEVSVTKVFAGNYNTVDDAIPAQESIGSDSFSNSMIDSSTPSWWPSGMTYPPFSPSGSQLTASLTANSYTNVPAGWRYEFGEDFGSEVAAAASATATTVNVGSFRAQ